MKVNFYAKCRFSMPKFNIKKGEMIHIIELKKDKTYQTAIVCILEDGTSLDLAHICKSAQSVDFYKSFYK